MRHRALRRFPALTGATAAVALAVGLGGCQQAATDQQMTAASLPSLPATLPLASGPAGDWPLAPAAASLPAAKPIATARVANAGDSYGYADAAYDYQDALGDAPPDYAFAYDGADPWAWEGYDQSRVFVEPIDQGYRYYYYRPGADTPYFVRDPDYGYGYADGRLAVVYDDFGGVVPYADYGPRVDYASRYWARGRDLFAASRRAERRAVNAADWAARSAAIADARARWMGLRERQAGWRDYHAGVAQRQATYWRQEQDRRRADTRRFADWRAEDFRGAPPPRAIPPAWQKASWARDDQRYLPPRDERNAHEAPKAAAQRGGPAVAGGRPGLAAASLDRRGQPPGAVGDRPRDSLDRQGPPRAAAATGDPPSAMRARDDRPEAAAAPAARPPSPDRRNVAPRQRPAGVERGEPGRGHNGSSTPRVEQSRPPRAEAAPQHPPRADTPHQQPRAEAPRSQPQARPPQSAPAPHPGGGGGGHSGGGGHGGGGGHDRHRG